MENSSRIALVTGANRGIGYAVAKRLLEKGITVIATSRNPNTGKQAIEKLQSFGSVVYHQLDVTDKRSIENCFAFAKAEYGRVDILINNAGINYDTWHNVATATIDEVKLTFQTNTFAVWQMIQSFLPLLQISKSANVVNVSSGAGSLNSQTGSTPGYSLSKLALNGLTLQFARQLHSDNIKVNSVCPGWVRTDMGGSGAFKSAEEGAKTIVWAALLKDSSITGKFFRDKVEIVW